MKKCLLCNAEYDERVEYCFRDGNPLGLPNTSSSKQKLVTNHLDSMGKHSMDSMETLDNISIDDLLQIGGPGGFQGFGEFTPLEAPASEDGNTQIMSRADLQNSMEQAAPSDSDDLESILDTFGSDIGAHLDDTLDGVQVGQVLDGSPLDFSSTNEILPGDTLDVLVDDLDVPKLTESDLNRYSDRDTLDDLDQWEASGPIMQEAARDALAQHRSRSEVQNEHEPNDFGAVHSDDSKKGPGKLPLIGGVLAVAALIFWMVSSGDSSEPQKTRDEMNAAIATPEIPMVPVVPVKDSNEKEEGSEPGGLEADTEAPTAEGKGNAVNEPTGTSANGRQPDQSQSGMKPAAIQQQPTSNAKQPKPNVQAVVASPVTDQPKSNANQTKPKSVSKKPEPSKPKPKKTLKKPKTEPKPMPKKDPEVDNGWGAVQAGGWGVESCGVTVSSNVSSAKVFVDGVQKGGVGKSISIDCGQHKLEVRADGYKSVTRSIDLMTDAAFTMDLER